MSFNIDHAGHVVVLDPSGSIFVNHCDMDSPVCEMARLDGRAQQITFAGLHRLWIISRDDKQLYRRPWHEESRGWDPQGDGAGLLKIAGGADGVLWCIRRGSADVCKWDKHRRLFVEDAAWAQLCERGFVRSDGTCLAPPVAMCISVKDSNNVWVVSEDGRLYFRSSTTGTWYTRSRWPVSVLQVSCGSDGDVWVIGANRRVVHGVPSEDGSDMIFSEIVAQLPPECGSESIVEVHIGDAHHVLAKTTGNRFLRWVATDEKGMGRWASVDVLNHLARVAPQSTLPPPITPKFSGPLIPSQRPLVVVMVGLPARGKTFVANKLMRFYLWLGIHARVFNVGNYRRQIAGAEQSHDFFDPSNAAASLLRRKAAEDAFSDMREFLTSGGGHVGIFDATNSTKERRQFLLKLCAESNFQTIFVETICNDMKQLDANIHETKLSSPDYRNVSPESAIDDFKQRIRHYESAYQPLDEIDCSYVKLVDVNRQITINRMDGFLQAKLVTLLLHSHIRPRKIYLSRHGESMFNVLGKTGGDSALSPRGEKYAVRLAEMIQRIENCDELVVWTSVLRRTIQTAANIHGAVKVSTPLLNELDSGLYDGLTYEEIDRFHPEEYRKRNEDKFRYRYPQGESYEDIIKRVESVILEVERETRPVLIVSHQAVIRCLYCWFKGRETAEAPFISIPLHTVFELTPKAYGCEEHRHFVEVDDDPHENHDAHQ